MKDSMSEAKKYYIERLKSGMVRHDYISKGFKQKFGVDPSVVRDALLESGHIQEIKAVPRSDGKMTKAYRYTGFAIKKNSDTWEDGSPRSKGNAFDWQNFATGLYTQSELSAVESGRRFGMQSASKHILSRWSI